MVRVDLKAARELARAAWSAGRTIEAIARLLDQAETTRRPGQPWRAQEIRDIVGYKTLSARRQGLDGP